MFRSNFNKLSLIAQLHSYLNKACLRMLVQELVISWIDYWNALYVGLPLRLTQRLQWLQNTVARLVADVSKFDYSSFGLPSLVTHCVLYEVQGFDAHRQSSPQFGTKLLVGASVPNGICLTNQILPVNAPPDCHSEGGLEFSTRS